MLGFRTIIGITQPPLRDGNRKTLFNIMPKLGLDSYVVGQDLVFLKMIESFPTTKMLEIMLNKAFGLPSLEGGCLIPIIILKRTCL